eukprot:TRINITY_DN7826_c0_g1_i1.p1 TRINITY_DN7826_c0_g1~~TRINITY_DN7826_c0_g1_i1.p1  ORF type:complete len:149 (-),score=32.55 TRINITY_DN7826_c0_g1_i1:111-557(-)
MEVLRVQRETLLATKKAKERELAQLIKKQDSLDKPHKEKETRYAPVPPHLQNNLLEETKKQYVELKKEHKQDRQMLKEQKRRVGQATRQTLHELNDLQLTVNILLKHFGLDTVPLEVTEYDFEEDAESIEPETVDENTEAQAMEVESH